MTTTPTYCEEVITLKPAPFSLGRSPIHSMDILGIKIGTPLEVAKKILTDEFGGALQVKTTVFRSTRTEDGKEITVASQEIPHALLVNTSTIQNGVEISNIVSVRTVPTLQGNPVFYAQRQISYSATDAAPSYGATLALVQAKYGKPSTEAWRIHTIGSRRLRRDMSGWEFKKDLPQFPAAGTTRMPPTAHVPHFATNDPSQNFAAWVPCSSQSPAYNDTEAEVLLDRDDGPITADTKLATLAVGIESRELCRLGFNTLKQQMDEAFLRASGLERTGKRPLPAPKL